MGGLVCKCFEEQNRTDSKRHKFYGKYRNTKNRKKIIVSVIVQLIVKLLSNHMSHICTGYISYSIKIFIENCAEIKIFT